MILLIDNYDSFTYNLYQMMGEISSDIRVVRNDALGVGDIAELKPDGILISPGPGRPEDAGICRAVIEEYRGRIPILGVCLGEQAICIAYGAAVGYAKRQMHGKQSVIAPDPESPLFAGLPPEIKVARYHSLAVKRDTLPAELQVTAAAEDGEVMAVEDRRRMVYGVQFHPESIMTPEGGIILSNFSRIAEGRGKAGGK